MIENLRQKSPEDGNTKSIASERPGSGESEKQSFLSANRTTVLMGLAFLAGLGWIAITKRNVKPFAQSVVESGNSFMVKMGVSDMRKQIPHGGEKLDPEVDRMVSAFYVKTSEMQIPVNELKKNPFMRYAPEQKDQTGKGGKDDLVDLDMSTEGLELQMTLVGDGIKSATISGFVMHEGDIINGWKILEILQDKVVIEKSGKKCVLSRNLRSMSKSADMGK
jgi:hypothetical protein